MSRRRFRKPWSLVLALALLATASGCATVRPLTDTPGREVGIASYYAHEHQGRTTSSGERFDIHEMTAAHRTLPFGTRVRVTNLDNGRSVVVRINDRGPWKKGRILDVSYDAARELHMIGPGTARVRLDVL
jgi:rare lipoprotein A